MIPFFIYYSMFGFQRIGDMMCLFGDARGKGFLAAEGRPTTLSGEGYSIRMVTASFFRSTVPTCASYDPAYAYEIAIIVQDRRHPPHVPGSVKTCFSDHITLYNENYAMPANAGRIANRKPPAGGIDKFLRRSQGQAQGAVIRAAARS